VSKAEDDLQATADSIIADSERLSDLEEQKRSLDPEDGERVGLSEEIASLGHRLGQATAAEAELAREAGSEDPNA
jgi:hypothetical protein